MNKRQEERKDYPEFFIKHINVIKNERRCCDECGERLTGHVSEVAHILPKQKFKSIATEDKNVIYLCGAFSTNQCHTNFDNRPNEFVKNMNIFNIVHERYKKLKEIITEKINYKVEERYGESK